MKVIIKLPKIIGFVVYYAWEVLLSNLAVAKEVLTPKHTMAPGIVGIPLDLKSDREINLLANLITMTPGTMSIDVSEDKKILFVYALHIDDVEEFKKEIKEKLESKVIKLYA